MIYDREQSPINFNHASVDSYSEEDIRKAKEGELTLASASPDLKVGNPQPSTTFQVEHDPCATIKIADTKIPTVDCPKHGPEQIRFSLRGFGDEHVEIGCAHCYAIVMRKLTQRFMHDGEPLQDATL